MATAEAAIPAAATGAASTAALRLRHPSASAW